MAQQTDFLSGLVTHDNVMIALIDLPNLLVLDDACRPQLRSSQPSDASETHIHLSTEQESHP